MKKLFAMATLLASLGAAQAHETTYNITTTWFEPQTDPKHTIFVGSFDYDEHTHTVMNLQGQLSESMTGMSPAEMVWLPLSYQLVSWKDNTLGGTFAAVFKNNSLNTFCDAAFCAETPPTDAWSPQTGVAVGGLHHGWPVKLNNPGNAYALIFVPSNPTAPLSQGQIDKLAYADCVPTAPGGMMAGGGMMGAVCMTGTSFAGYGATGTMDGYPLSQTITAAVPEPETYAMLLAGLGLIGALARRRCRGT
jgi:hypothetical protein